MRNFLNIIWVVICGGQMIGQSSIQDKVTKLLQDQQVHPSVFSIHAYNTSTGKECLNYRGNELMIPASSMKVITTFTAIDLLGKNFKYETSVGYTGTVGRDGTLNGDLVIEGSGDPSLGSFREGFGPDYNIIISKIGRSVKSAGIKCIDGRIIVDDSRFERGGTHPGWSWNDVGNYYGAGVHGVNINENEYLVHFDRNVDLGSLVRIEELEPDVPGLKIDCRVTLAEAGTGDNAYIYGGEGFFQKIIKGTIPAGKGRFTIRGSLPDPPLLMAQLIAQELDNQGITSSGISISQNDKPLNKILSFKSKSFKELVKIANSRSINLYCEAFLRSISDAGSSNKALDRIIQHIDSIGLDTLSIIQKDGSGLSGRNVISSQLFTQFLSHYYHQWKGNALELLPRASYEGTVSGLLKSKRSRGKAWLKSGYIGGVLSYTGYVKNQKGEIISISIMANNFQKRVPEIREMCEKIIEEVYLY